MSRFFVLFGSYAVYPASSASRVRVLNRMHHKRPETYVRTLTSDFIFPILTHVRLALATYDTYVYHYQCGLLFSFDFLNVTTEINISIDRVTYRPSRPQHTSRPCANTTTIVSRHDLSLQLVTSY